MNRSLEVSFKSWIRKLAEAKRIDPAQLWQNLVLERFLVRLSQSEYAPHFILKGGVLLSHYVELDRYTQDLDFLVQKLSNAIPNLEKILKSVIQLTLSDGFTFSDLRVGELPHFHMKYPGIRATMWSFFGKTRCKMHVDLGFGDIIKPDIISIPLLRSDQRALLESEVKVNCYPKEFIFAEKLETIVYRGADNSRMKDFHDLNVLIHSGLLDNQKTAQIIEQVFEHRNTKREFPIFFSPEELNGLQKFWAAHLRGLPSHHKMPSELNEVITTINSWLEAYTNSSLFK